MKRIALIFVLLAAALSAATQNIEVGKSFTIGYEATGTRPFTHQWFKNGVAIPGAISATYTVTAATVADTGNYTVRLTNSAGSTTSDNAIATVLVVAPGAAKALFLGSDGRPLPNSTTPTPVPEPVTP